MSDLNAIYDRLEDDNHHGPCAVLAAIAGDDAAAIRRLGEIIREHERIGHMPYKLTQERYALVKDYYKLLPNRTAAPRYEKLLSAIVDLDYDAIIRNCLEV